jgi:hypothetical protein
MIPMITSVKFSLTTGMFPNQNPARTQIDTHAALPETLYRRKRRYGMLPMPATNGANVLTIGTKRAIKIVLPP